MFFYSVSGSGFFAVAILDSRFHRPNIHELQSILKGPYGVKGGVMGRRNPVRLTVWLSDGELARLREVCGLRGCSCCETVRLVIRGFLLGCANKGARCKKGQAAFIDGGLFRGLEAGDA